MGAHKALANTHKHLWGTVKRVARFEHLSGTPAPPLRPVLRRGGGGSGRLITPCLTRCLLVAQEPSREEALLQQLKEKDELILRLQGELVSASRLRDVVGSKGGGPDRV